MYAKIYTQLTLSCIFYENWARAGDNLNMVYLRIGTAGQWSVRDNRNDEEQCIFLCLDTGACRSLWNIIIICILCYPWISWLYNLLQIKFAFITYVHNVVANSIRCLRYAIRYQYKRLSSKMHRSETCNPARKLQCSWKITQPNKFWLFPDLFR